MKFTGFTERTFSFLMELSFNNNKTFFEEHRAEYVQHVQMPLLALEEAIRDTVLAIDPLVRTGRGAVSRIYRDTRFSRDKAPFRDHMWLGYKHEGEENAESFGFYFEITPVSYGYGMGSYGANKAFMDRFRAKVLAAPARFEHIVTEPTFAATFTLRGEDYKKQKAIDVNEILRPWVSKKRFYIEYSCNDLSRARSETLVDEVIAGLECAAPLYRFSHDDT